MGKGENATHKSMTVLAEKVGHSAILLPVFGGWFGRQNINCSVKGSGKG